MLLFTVGLILFWLMTLIKLSWLTGYTNDQFLPSSLLLVVLKLLHSPSDKIACACGSVGGKDLKEEPREDEHRATKSS